ncbi:hypothetical protein CEQ90_15440 [Lewinellaceae bacterium SD302]|nr:hypothetical protein CEQ90_15440 [Lewinellaceae bacterium SD302]
MLMSGLYAQNGLPPAGANRGMALGGTGVSFQDHHAVWTNPAGLAGVDDFGLNLAGEQRFGLSELQQVSLGAALGTELGGFGFSLSSFGYASLRESRIGLSYGRSLSENFRIGGELLGLNTSIEGYDSRFTATFSLGMQIDILRELTVGFRAYSPFRVETAEGEFLPQLFSVGFSYQPNKKLTLLTQVDQDLDEETRIRVGLEYLVTEAFTLRIGGSSGPAELSFGVEYLATEEIRIQVAGRYHETLGITPGVGVVYAR